MGDIIYAAILQKSKEIREMEATKLILSFLGWFGVPLYIYAYIINLDNVKSTILFIVALIITLIRLYYWVVRVKQNNRLREIEIRGKEQAFEEKRVELIERELRARITGIPKK